MLVTDRSIDRSVDGWVDLDIDRGQESGFVVE